MINPKILFSPEIQLPTWILGDRLFIDTGCIRSVEVDQRGNTGSVVGGGNVWRGGLHATHAFSLLLNLIVPRQSRLFSLTEKIKPSIN